MSKLNAHHQRVDKQFGEQAKAYLTSAVHAQGPDLNYVAERLASFPQAEVLDLGCGAGHVSFMAAPLVKSVTAYDLSEQMLNVVKTTANERQLTNLFTQHGTAEVLPFADNSFDIVTSRYSIHHWHDVGKSMREVRRVLKPNGMAILMDVISPGVAVFDIWLQTVEALRDTSHVRDYTAGELIGLIGEAGLILNYAQRHRLPLNFDSWITRMRTPSHFVEAIRAYQQQADNDSNNYFALQADGSFIADMLIIEAQKII